MIQFKTSDECNDLKNDTVIEDKNLFKKTYNVLESPKDYYTILEKNYIPPKIKINAKSKNNENYLNLLNKKLGKKMYQSIDMASIKNTFFYMLLKFHIGLYISIRDNKIHQFYLIRNSRMINQYPHLQLDPKYFKKYKIQPLEYWKMMGCMVNAVLSPLEGAKVIFNKDTAKKRGYRPPGYYFEIKTWLDMTLKTRKVSDVDFFLNLFDQLIVTDNNTEPLFHFFDQRNVPLKSNFIYNKLCPIISIGHTMDGYLDLPFVTSDDISRITQKVYPGMCGDAYIQIKGSTINTNWNKKIPTGMFRGSATGCGTYIKNNPRIRIAYCNKKWETDDRYNNKNPIDKIPFLNAGLTGKKLSFKKHYGDKYIRHIEEIIDTDDVEKKVDIVEKMTLSKQSNYKYIINIEGYVSAFRLTYLFSFNSVVLYVDNVYKPWYYCFLVDYENVIFIKKDLSNLADIITWLKKNDSKAKKIAENGFKLYKTQFSKKGMLDYTELLLNTIAENIS
jgi:hypothetical protein